MTNRIVVAMLLSMLSLPAFAGDAAWYWDRYAVASTSERVPANSDTSPAYRNQYAVMTQEAARAEATAQTARNAAGATDAKKDGRGGCKCECARNS